MAVSWREAAPCIQGWYHAYQKTALHGIPCDGDDTTAAEMQAQRDRPTCTLGRKAAVAARPFARLARFQASDLASKALCERTAIRTARLIQAISLRARLLSTALKSCHDNVFRTTNRHERNVFSMKNDSADGAEHMQGEVSAAVRALRQFRIIEVRQLPRRTKFIVEHLELFA